MIQLLTQYLTQTMLASLVAFALIGVIKRTWVPHATSGSLPGAARWSSFLLITLLGAVQGTGFLVLTHWATTQLGGVLQIGADIAQVVGVGLGMFTIAMTTSTIRDLADKIPDEEARQFGQWVWTTGPAGWSAVMGVLHNPRGIGSGITAALVGAEALIFAAMIAKRALNFQNSEHETAWKWYAFVVKGMAGLIAVPLFVYADATIASVLAGFIPGWIVALVRGVLAATGIGLLIAGIGDIFKDKQPDMWARAFCAYGIPLLFVYGALGTQILNSGANAISSISSAATTTTHAGTGAKK